MITLFIEPHADGLLDLAVRADALGHRALYFCKDYDQYKVPVGRGIVERVADWRPHMRQADLVVLGGNGYCMAEFDRWRHEGVAIVGGTVESASWELDRAKGMAVFKKAGIDVPPYRQASSYDEAIALAGRYEDGCAIKPSGDVTDKSLSFVAKSPDEAEWRLRGWKREGKKFGQGLIVQQRIKGVEFACGGWFGPEGFVPGWEENWEGKKFFAGDLGPNTGEMYTVMRLTKASRLSSKVLAPLEDQLSRIGFVGNCDVNCIIDEDGVPWPLEFTMRCGWPSTNIELALHEGDPIEFLAAVAFGEKPPARKLDTFAVGIVMAIPPFPFPGGRTEDTVGVPIWGITPGIEGNIHLCEAMVADGQLATAGAYVLVATGTGDTVVKARAGALRVLNRLRCPASPYWRIDAGVRLRAELPELQKHGFAAGAVYA